MGRDVQCSNCGQTWFQAGALSEVATSERQDVQPVSGVPAPHSAEPDPFDGWEDTAANEDDEPQAAIEPAEHEASSVAQAPANWPDLEREIEAAMAADETAPAKSLEDGWNRAQAEQYGFTPEEATNASDPQDVDDTAQPTSPEPQDAVLDRPAQGAWESQAWDEFQTPDVVPEQSADAFDEDYEDAPAPTAIPARRTMDDDLLAVLREEAAREVQARKAEGSALEVQPELGLAAIKPTPRAPLTATRDDADDFEHEVRLNSMDTMPDANAPRATRRDLLPDIEEINSSLRATSDRAKPWDKGDPVLDHPKVSAFKIGFLTVIFTAVIGVGVYVAAPKVSALWPQAAPLLSTYSAKVDDARLWLDQQMLDITQALRERDA
jgi:hypothetical protein